MTAGLVVLAIQFGGYIGAVVAAILVGKLIIRLVERRRQARIPAGGDGPPLP